MTDADIIKALEMCTSCGCIESCPMFFNGTDSTSNCRYALLGKALTLINRQKAEIERLKEGATIPVRCGECRYFDIEDWLGVRTYKCNFAIVEFDVNPNTYCSYGERKEE